MPFELDVDNFQISHISKIIVIIKHLELSILHHQMAENLGVISVKHQSYRTICDLRKIKQFVSNGNAHSDE